MIIDYTDHLSVRDCAQTKEAWDKVRKLTKGRRCRMKEVELTVTHYSDGSGAELSKGSSAMQTPEKTPPTTEELKNMFSEAVRIMNKNEEEARPVQDKEVINIMEDKLAVDRNEAEQLFDQYISITMPNNVDPEFMALLITEAYRAGQDTPSPNGGDPLHSFKQKFSPYVMQTLNAVYADAVNEGMGDKESLAELIVDAGRMKTFTPISEEDYIEFQEVLHQNFEEVMAWIKSLI